MLHKPLLVHVVSEVWGFCMHLYLRAIGFRHADMEVRGFEPQSGQIPETLQLCMQNAALSVIHLTILHMHAGV